MSDGIEIALSSVTDTSGLVPSTRKINTTGGLQGGGDLSADRTISEIPISDSGAWAFAMWGQGSVPSSTADGGVGFFGANQPLYYPLLITKRMSISRVTLRIATAIAASNVYVALYDASKNKLAGSDFPAISSAAIGIQVSVLGVSIILEAGIYWVGIAEDSLGVAITGFGVIPANTYAIFNQNVAKNFTGGNNLAAGVMPASVGAITPRTGSQMVILFEP